MIYCPGCSRKIPRFSSFCPHCAQEFPGSVPEGPQILLPRLPVNPFVSLFGLVWISHAMVVLWKRGLPDAILAMISGPLVWAFK